MNDQAIDPIIYDVIIIGVGPAALTASIYASRYQLTNLVVGKNLGGEIANAHKVENYPGFLSISGLDLAEKWKQHAEALGGHILIKEVGKVDRATDSSGGFLVKLTDDKVYRTTALIVTTGSERRRLNIPGETQYVGRGVSYCTTCDSPFYRQKTVALIGGSDSAVSGSIHTGEYAAKIYIIYRGDKLRAEPVWIQEWEKLVAKKQGETIYNTNPLEILGDGTKVTGLKLDRPYQDKEVLPVDGVFVEIGGVPGTALVQPLGVKIDDTGHVIVSDKMETNIPGLFCAGDMTDRSRTMKQAITAMAQGATAAASAYRYLKNETAPQIRGI
jgi:thioredoxin reductase (NADPH)